MLYKHQEDAVKFIMSRGGSGAIFHEMGLGKTRSAIEIYSRLRVIEPSLRLLTVCPISLIESAWGHDIEKFTSYKYNNMHDDKFNKNADIFLINPESAFTAKGKELLGKILSSGKTMICIDESSKIKSPKAKITKNILSVRKFFQYRLVMSGTPAPNDECEYWSQIAFVSPTTFPDNFFKFRNTFFALSRGNQTIQGKIMSRSMAREIFSQGWKYKLHPAMRGKFMTLLNGVSHWAKKKDCLDLPDTVDEFRDVEMSDEQYKHYREMERDAYTEISGSNIPAQVALTKLMKLRQISSGFAISPTGEVVRMKTNPKMNELVNTLEEVGDQQVIIWCQFHEEIRQIVDVLKDKAVTLYGETKDKEGSINAFRDGEVQYLIAHPRSAGYGLTFTGCSVQVFYSLDYSYEMYEQSKARTHRMGQKNSCTYIHLMVKKSIDKNIMDVLKRKGTAENLIYEWIRSRS